MSARQIASGYAQHGSLGAIGATALQLIATATPLVRGIQIRADDGNAANFVYVGLAAVTAGIGAAATDGYKLKAGESVVVPIDDASKIYVVGSTTGLAVSWIGN